MIDISLKTADSFLTGASIGANGADRITNLSFDNASTWNMAGDSVVNALINNNNAVIDLTQGADTLNVTDYSGTGGKFVMDTDLASETNGDKIAITGATAGITYVQVKDSSLLSGIEVTGNKSLLLITDTSEKATFTGKHLNAGGIWDVTPTIENGADVTKADGSTGSKKEWYLTKIEKVINNDTGVLLSTMDNSYALWRNTNDSLRKRLGDLRFRDNTVDGDGIWARYSGGKFAGSGNFDGSFNMYQLGYDKAANAKSIYGFAVENGSGHTSYSYGSGKDKLFAGSIYGTWHGDNSSYTDVVARFGQFDTDIRSYGDYPDKAKAKSHAYSLSVEYGKTIELNKAQGTFIEPQAQLIVGRLGSSSYTTDRGNNVYMGGVNSCIGRLGVVAGKKDASGNDVYLKVNMLHEFGGNRDVRMLAGNGETLSESQDYGDTWFELGLGGNIKLGNSSHLYGDIERSFGADIQKKWQVNAGVRFEF
ncbi:autotransporter outer membrane beta-barrel domain-containing protein [Phascolarctobacterium faecium]|uniref:autotransporter outer membrane beta-barrel domain-containing protein n=1 Tax=Phascolarctobacterium faecium TaxID=33025 RepID=UPI003AB8B12B